MLLLTRNLAVLLLITVASHIYGAEPLNLRVVWKENPQTQAVVLWDSIGAGTGVLQVREGNDSKTHQAAVTKYSTYRKKHEGGGDTPDSQKPPMLTDCYLVELTGLKPSTKYILTAKVGDATTKEHYFITAPDKDVDFKIFFAGDSRSRVSAAREVSEMIRKAFEEDSSYMALVHGGDYTADSTTLEYTAWLNAYSLTTTSDGRVLPIILVRGNHDRGSGFEVAYGGKDKAFNCMLSPQVSLLVSGNTEFLETELAKLEAQQVRYRMAAYHRPVYPAIKLHTKKEGTPPRAALFEKYNLDLGLESDGHCIKRTVPIRDDKEADDGVVYLGEGGYGAPQKSPKKDLWYLQEPGFASRGDHYMALSFTKSAIEYWTMQVGKGKVDSASFPAKTR